ncbi:MAG: DUF2066 domain-containing protein [Rhodospirillaceae bacterium]|nr:DUF2066 domain-containing protein [Rhodospirillaceae bacterium]MBT7030596.1 DUF2066 domain-containing protein [Rhodospirillaceae bacterium]
MRVWTVLPAMLALALIGSQAGAQSLGVFTVSGVAVDEVAESAEVARKKALANGERKAFERLFKRLTVRVDHVRAGDALPEDISALVQDIQVADQKNSQIRYLAKLTFRFKPTAVREFLRDMAVDFAETRSKPVLVLPVYESAGAVSLWDDSNIWRDAFAAIDIADGLVPMQLPRGDLSDIRALGGGELAIQGDAPRLTSIAKNYGVSAVIVAHAQLTATRRGVPAINISAKTHGSAERYQSINTSVSTGKGETVKAMLARGAAEAVGLIEDQWKLDNLLQFGLSAVLATALPITGLSDWVEAQRRLKKVAVIERVDLILLSRNEARINLFYLGDPDQLKLALAQADLSLVEEEGSWSLALTK